VVYLSELECVGENWVEKKGLPGWTCSWDNVTNKVHNWVSHGLVFTHVELVEGLVPILEYSNTYFSWWMRFNEMSYKLSPPLSGMMMLLLREGLHMSAVFICITKFIRAVICWTKS
jgi:hypothetical protein